MTEIGVSAFSGCKSLTTFKLPPLLKTIKERTFSGCTSLSKVEFPPSLENIEAWAFDGCGAGLAVPSHETLENARLRSENTRLKKELASVKKSSQETIDGVTAENERLKMELGVLKGALNEGVAAKYEKMLKKEMEAENKIAGDAVIDVDEEVVVDVSSSAPPGAAMTTPSPPSNMARLAGMHRQCERVVKVKTEELEETKEDLEDMELLKNQCMVKDIEKMAVIDEKNEMIKALRHEIEQKNKEIEEIRSLSEGSGSSGVAPSRKAKRRRA